MRYLLAFVLPPLAVLLCGRPIQALLSIGLTLLGWAPGVIHALLVVNNYYADQRVARMERATRERTEVLRAAIEEAAGERACPACGHRARRGERFCANCGAALP